MPRMLSRWEPEDIHAEWIPEGLGYPRPMFSPSAENDAVRPWRFEWASAPVSAIRTAVDPAVDARVSDQVSAASPWEARLELASESNFEA